MAINDFSKSYANFKSELSMRFTDELILIKQDCLGLQEIKEVYEIYGGRANKEVVFKASDGATVDAQYEVKKLAQALNKQYRLKLIFK